jgi:fermentation-respiration switch protein FrsA (DUF1100 family)
VLPRPRLSLAARPATLREGVLAVAGLAVLAWGGLWAGAVGLQEHLLFPGRHRPDTDGAHAAFARDVERGEVRLQGWYVPATSADAPVLVYYGGNNEELAEALPRLRDWIDAHWLLVNYRGYGASEGTPGQAVLVEDALAVLDGAAAEGLLDPARTVLVGRSLGSGVAMQVAARRELAGVVLLTPFDSVRRLAGEMFWFLPVRGAVRHPFDSAAVAPAVDEPALVVIAGRDRLVPPPATQRLIDAFERPVATLVLPGADHDAALGRRAAFTERLASFVGRVTGTADP